MEGNVDPVRDIEIIHEELRLKDEETIPLILDKLEKAAIRGGDKRLKPEHVSMCLCFVFPCFTSVSLHRKGGIKKMITCNPSADFL